jgi:hypothetical protein
MFVEHDIFRKFIITGSSEYQGSILYWLMRIEESDKQADGRRTPWTVSKRRQSDPIINCEDSEWVDKLSWWWCDDVMMWWCDAVMMWWCFVLCLFKIWTCVNLPSMLTSHQVLILGSKWDTADNTSTFWPFTSMFCPPRIPSPGFVVQLSRVVAEPWYPLLLQNTRFIKQILMLSQWDYNLPAACTLYYFVIFDARRADLQRTFLWLVYRTIHIWSFSLRPEWQHQITTNRHTKLNAMFVNHNLDIVSTKWKRLHSVCHVGHSEAAGQHSSRECKD